MKIDVEEVTKLQNAIHKINETSLSDIDFYENGVKIDVPDKTIREWNYIGLNNVDFITMQFYKRKF